MDLRPLESRILAILQVMGPNKVWPHSKITKRILFMMEELGKSLGLTFDLSSNRRYFYNPLEESRNS